MRIHFRKILTGYLIILHCFLIKAQDYHPMLGNTNEWYVIHSFEGSYTIKYLLKGDTLINGVEYKIMGKEIFTDSILIREDSINRKVYWFKDGKDIVYYDFSLNKNDSIYLDAFDKNYTDWYFVDSTNTINILGGIRKAIYLKGNVNKLGSRAYPVWIESVGTIGDPYYPEITANPFGVGELSCFFKNGSKIYQSEQSSIYNECIFNGIKSMYFEDINAYPNPTNGKFGLKSSEQLNIQSIKLIDMVGQSTIINSFNNFFDISRYSAGVYIVSILGLNNKLKIIKE
jgi:hypothetical protein